MGVVDVSGFDSDADGDLSSDADSSFGSNADVGIGSNADVGIGCEADGGAAQDGGRESRAGDGGETSGYGRQKDISCDNMEGVKIVLMMVRVGRLATIVEK